MLVGFIMGSCVAPRIASEKPIILDGEQMGACGLSVLATMFYGGIVGGTLGLVIGVVVAWFLPTPLQNQVSEHDLD